MHKKRLAWALLVTSSLAIEPILADEIVSLKAGYLVLSPEGVFAVDSGGVIGSEVDLEEDLGYDDSEELYLEAAFNLGPFRLAASYLPIEFSGSGTLTEEIKFNGETFAVGADVQSDVELDLYDIGLTWNLINIDDLPLRFQFGPELAVKVVDAEVSMADVTGTLSESASATAPIPTIGARARLAFADYFGLVGRVGYLEYDDNRFLDAEAQIEFSPIPTLGIFAGYRYLELEVDESDVFIDATLDGPYGGLLVRF